MQFALPTGDRPVAHPAIAGSAGFVPSTGLSRGLRRGAGLRNEILS